MITVHHLESSRSQRVPWLLEELGVPYEIKRYARDPKTLFAPPELRAIHPLGKSPVITDDGIVVAESMSHGVPVLASRIGALAETTRDDVSGLLFAPGDVDDLALKMTRIWNDDTLCRRLGAGGRQQVVDQCTDARHLELTLAAYRTASHSPRRPT